MKTVAINLYSVNELDETAKQRAFQDYCGSDQYFSGDDNKNTLYEFERIFPVKIKSWEYGFCNSYINFEFDTYENEQEIKELSGVRLLKYIINNYYEYLYSPKTFTKIGIYLVGKENKKRKSKIIFQKDNSKLTGYYMDEEIIDPIYKYLEKPNKYTSFYDLMNDCLQSWLVACNKDFEYAYSEEAFIEDSEANERLYFESGKLY
jgi:hypothetical protein